MQRLLAITSLTWKAAFRFRLFWVVALLLVGSVTILPLVIRDDGTARGFTQILLTYTLGVVATLLGFCTLWLSCGTLARDIEDNQMQMVVVKPVARWQIWLGKWLGLLTLNAALLAISGACIYFLLMFRAQELPPDQQRILREEVFVSRGSLKEPQEDIEQLAERIFLQQTKDAPVNNPAAAEAAKAILREQLKATPVQPNTMRRWTIDLGHRTAFLRDEPLFVRLKFHAAGTNILGTFRTVLDVGPPGAPRSERQLLSLSDGAFHEIKIAPNLWDEKGVLTVNLENRDSVVLLVPNDEGFEILYREGGFALNFIRALLIVLFWLALLSAIGLSAASFLSFPVAAFVSASLMMVALSSGTIASVVESGTIMGVNEETGEVGRSVVDWIVVPVFKALLGVFKLVGDFSPIDALSTGRSIEWIIVAQAFGNIVLLLGGVVAAIGIALFSARELAASQSHS